MPTPFLDIGKILPVNAFKYPDRMAFRDIRRQLTFSELDVRVNRLANAMHDMGLRKGDRFCVLLNNCIEFCEIYLAAAKAGTVAVPINTRYVAREAAYVVNNAEAKALFAGAPFLTMLDDARDLMPAVPEDRWISVLDDESKPGWKPLESLVDAGSTDAPDIEIVETDTWIQLYTSGTTGNPKGVVRSHGSYTAFYLINATDFSYKPTDIGLTLMPLFHVNSTFYAFVFTYIGGGVYIHRDDRFDPVELLEVIDREKPTFASMIPTHYNLILNIPEDEAKKYDVSSIECLLCSSAPVHKQTKLNIMEFFAGCRLFEAYGSTEAGLVTLLRPEDQMKKLGAIGLECVGTGKIQILDDDRKPVKQGEVGELFSWGPMLFDEYYNMPGKTADSHEGLYFSAGDMARQDEEGYYYIVDRKHNMIITGGEHVYPNEMEEIISRHPKVFDAAVIGTPHPKWGEQVMAVVIAKEGVELDGQEIIDFVAPHVAAFKKPKAVAVIAAEDMPRTATGKIQHHVLKERYSE
jgi:acyl-CoA synthetase (AMP-forming)/AMP-acid ligase II